METDREPPAVVARSRLRAARVARSISQQQLAELAGVSRQAIAAVEANRSEPSLRLALALGEALGMSVESLFGTDSALPPLQARSAGDLGPPGSRAALATVGGALVAAPLEGHAAARVGFTPANGLVGEEPSTYRPLAPLRPTLVVAGCDPALALLETPLAHLDPPVSFVWRSCGSGRALELAAEGLVHVAGVHRRDRDRDTYNEEALTGLAGKPPRRLGFATWRQGLILRSGTAARVHSLRALVDAGLRIVNREDGSEARAVVEREALASGIAPASIPGFATEVHGHLEVAAAIAGGLADAGVASEPAALAYGLDFIPLTTERFDLVVTEELAQSPEVQALARVLAAPWLRRQLGAIPGYDATTCGETFEREQSQRD